MKSLARGNLPPSITLYVDMHYGKEAAAFVFGFVTHAMVVYTLRPVKS